MKAVTAIMLMGCLHLSAATLSQTISLRAKNEKLSHLFDEITRQTKYLVIYNDRIIKGAPPVSVSAEDMPLEEFLTEITKPQGLNFSIQKNTVLITRAGTNGTMSRTSPLPLAVTLQRRITGKVTDHLGKPFPGVNVRVKGSSSAVISTDDGTFSITVGDADAVLVFSYLGFRTTERKVGNEGSLTVMLEPQEDELDEVLVVGYGEVRKADLTGSVGQVRMNDIAKAPVASYADALAGRIAGVQVSSADGQPGVGMDIVIRGANSLTQDNSPLYVIDGFPVEDPDNAAINPDDILAINILKDASATAIYGSRGANGVVIIETKRGKAGKPVITFNSSVGYQQPQKLIEMMSPYEFVKLQLEITTLSAKQSYTPADLDPLDTLYNPLGRTLEDYRHLPGTDWQGLVLTESPMQIYNMAIRGGTAQTKYAISGSVFDQEGIILNTGFNRYQGRITLDQTVNKKLKVGVTSNFTKMMRHGQYVAGGGDGNFTTSLLYRAWAYRPVTGSGLDLTEFDDDPENTNESDIRINPVVTSMNDYTRNGSFDFVINGFAEYKFFDDLTLRLMGAATSRKSRQDRFFNSRTPQGNPRNKFNLRGINGSVRNNNSDIWSSENTLTYKRTFNKDHRVTAIGGFSVQRSESDSYGFSTQRLPNEDLGMHGLDEGTPFLTVASGSEDALMSYYGRMEYNFRSKYLVTATLRADGSSKFVQAERWGYFPSAAIAWNMAEEDVFKSLPYISNSKLRLSYGRTGNNRVGPFETHSIRSLPIASSYSFGNNLPTQAIVPTKLGNEQLKWETTGQVNLGYDLGLFKNRIEFTFDIYRKTTNDLLLNANMPAATGYATAFKNIGSIQNEGIEFTLNTINLSGNGFQWSSNFNIAFNRNKVLSLTRNEERMFSTARVGQDVAPLYVSEIGKPAGLFYGRIFDGVYQFEDFDNPAPGVYILKPGIPGNGQTTAIQPGHIKYRDLNEDGVLDNHDMAVIGRGQPVHIGGFINDFTYKGFNLSVFLQWSYGNQIYNANRMLLDGHYLRLAATNQYASYVDRWSPENPTNRNFKVGGAGPAGVQSTRVLEDGSYLRLKTVSLSYTLPARYITKLYLSKLNLVASAQNLLTFTNYSGMDPEVSVMNSVLTPGFDYSAYPQARTITFGLQASFR